MPLHSARRADTRSSPHCETMTPLRRLSIWNLNLQQKRVKITNQYIPNYATSCYRATTAIICCYRKKNYLLIVAKPKKKDVQTQLGTSWCVCVCVGSQRRKYRFQPEARNRSMVDDIYVLHLVLFFDLLPQLQIRTTIMGVLIKTTLPLPIDKLAHFMSVLFLSCYLSISKRPYLLFFGQHSAFRVGLVSAEQKQNRYRRGTQIPTQSPMAPTWR